MSYISYLGQIKVTDHHHPYYTEYDNGHKLARALGFEHKTQNKQ